MKIDFQRLDQLIAMALSEDLGGIGDATSIAVIPENTVAGAVLRCKEDCVCAGLAAAERVFSSLSKDICFNGKVKDGDFCKKGTVLAEVSGNARLLLTGERTALNFLQRLCGIATVARRYAQEVSGTDCMILDTRKTTPGWRNLQKYAVAAGGAGNHRIGLYDRVMIKDNHRELAGLEGEGGITRSVERSRAAFPKLEVEVEADTLDEVAEALKTGADYVLLDNMSDEQMREAVAMRNKLCPESKLEASGGITLERIGDIAKLGLDFISVGALTHSVKSSDISMEIQY